MADFLMRKIFEVVEQQDPSLRGWCADELKRRKDYDRLQSLQFLAGPNLDDSSRRAVCTALGFTIDDLTACGRVLAAI